MRRLFCNPLGQSQLRIEFARLLQKAFPPLQDLSYESPRRALKPPACYEGIDHTAAREILHGLNGADLITDDEIQSQ